MPHITLKDGHNFEAEDNTRLILALVDHGVDVLHRCGGFAKCTTCRVSFIEGEPEQMTQAEHDRLKQSDLLGEVRLSCQILCDHDMTVEPLMSLENTGLDDRGKRPQPAITPEPEWIDVPDTLKDDTRA